MVIYYKLINCSSNLWKRLIEQSVCAWKQKNTCAMTKYYIILPCN